MATQTVSPYDFGDEGFGEFAVLAPRRFTASLVADPHVEADLRTPVESQVTDELVTAWQGVAPAEGALPGEAPDDTPPPRHVGVNVPQQWVVVRTGRFLRGYKHWDNGSYPVNAQVGPTSSQRPWQATWHPTSAYVRLPNILSVDTQKDMENANGVGSATIDLENILYPANAGGGHAIRRGYLAPLRGYLTDFMADHGHTAPKDLDGTLVTPNEWTSKLVPHKAQVTVFQTYGLAKGVKSYTGLIDDVDSTSSPFRMTITSRDFGEVLTDEKVIGWNKDYHVDDPVVFVGPDDAYDITHSAYGPAASSHIDQRTASLAIDSDSGTSWRSDHRTTPDVTEWVEIDLREGTYNDYQLDTRFAEAVAGQTYDHIYVALRVEDQASGDPATRDDANLDSGWVDQGLGTIPGSDGTPYIVDMTDVPLSNVRRALDARYVLGKDSTLRIYFRGLPSVGSGLYAAGVTDIFGYRQKLNPETARAKWVIVDDVADIVKVVLRWAGFKEWYVENVGAPPGKRILVDRSMSHMDIIQQLAQDVGYVFFMGDPTNWSGSIGVPTFRKTRALVAETNKLVLTDRMLLTAIDIKDADEPLSYIIRVRGRSDEAHGVTWGDVGGRRIMFTFRPPWIGDEDSGYEGRLGGILKHATIVNEAFRTMRDCRFGAYYVALQEALQSITATVECPPLPGVIDLDDHARLSDLGTGISTRLSVTRRATSFTYGEQSKWTMTLGGALIDTPDVQAMVDIINAEAG